MLAKKYRLQIQEWHKERKKTETRKSDFFIIRISKSGLPLSRFGVVVGLKFSKSAVKRNKIKRAIFDFIRLNKLHEIAGNDAVINVLPKAAELKKEELKKELKLLLSIF